MKRRLKLYRFIADGDDGHSYWHCVSCREKFEMAGRWKPFIFCPFCGIKFDGELIWDIEAHYEKKRRLHPDWIKETYILWEGQIRIKGFPEDSWSDLFKAIGGRKNALQEIRRDQIQKGIYKDRVAFEYRLLLVERPKYYGRDEKIILAIYYVKENL